MLNIPLNASKILQFPLTRQTLDQACVLVLLILLIRFAINKYMSDLRHVPGPFLAGFTRLWKLHSIQHGQMEQVQIRLHEKYGSVVRIAPNEVLISDPSAIKTIYGHTANFKKTKFYIPFGVKENDDLFTDSDIARHAHNRRELASAYSMTSLVALETFVDECTRTMCDRIRSLFARERKPFALANWLQFYAFDVIGQITFSQPFGFMREGKDIQDCIAKLERYLVHGAFFSVIPEYWPLYYVVLTFLAKFGLVLRPGLEVFSQFVATQIKDRLERRDVIQTDFVSKLQSMGHSESTIWRSCFTNIAAGSDTTAISLRSIMYFLLQDPSAYRRLQEEIDQFSADGKISNPVTFGEALQMPYLQAVMKEAMRVHPAVQWSMPRYVPDSKLKIGSFDIPAGSEVGVNPYVIHRNKEIFGDDADKFRPERWLEDKDRAREMDRYMIQFGVGSRVCIGKNVSLMEMSKLLPQLLRNFDFELCHPETKWKVSNFWFAKQSNMDCYVTERKQE